MKNATVVKKAPPSSLVLRTTEDNGVATLTLNRPAQYNALSEALLEALEKELMGKSTGKPFEVVIPCSEAYGVTTDDAIVMIPKTVFELDGAFDEEHIQEGEAIAMNDEDGNEMVGVVVSISKTEVEMDFNHPLAELDLHFIGSICDIREEA